MHALWLLGLSALAASPAAELDTEVPYSVTVCLRFTSHPIFTPLFVESVQRQVETQLDTYFRPLARISVRVRGHWLVDEFRSASVEVPPPDTALWERLESGSRQSASGDEEADKPLDVPGSAQGSADKVFLVVVDYARGQYELRWRELDVGARRSGRIQFRRTPDRQWVSRALGLAVQGSFGLAARVRPISGSDEVSLDFRGAGQTEKLAELAGEDCVLQPYRVLRGRDGYDRVPIPGTLLRVRKQKDGGLRRAAVFSNLADPWKRSAAIVGFEAYTVSTRPGRLRLKVIDAATGQPAVSCYVSANDTGFDAFTSSHALGSPDPRGTVTSGPLRHIAFVQVAQENSTVVRWPFAITESLDEQTIKVFIDNAAGEKNQFQRRLRFAVRDIQTLHAVQSDATRRLNQLSNAGSKRYEEALELARRTVGELGPLLGDVQTAAAALRKEAPEVEQGDSKLLAWLVGQLEQVEQQHAGLVRLREDLATAIDTQEAAERAKVAFELGLQAESQGDIEEAISRYEAALNEFEDPAMRRKLESVRAIWKLGESGDHRRAHRLIYERWATAEVTQLRAQLDGVLEAFQILKAGGDALRARKLLAINGRHIEDVSVLLDQLAQRDGEADRAEYDEYAALVDDIAALQQEVGAFVKQAARDGAAKPDAAPAEGAPPPIDIPPSLDQGAEPPLRQDE